MNWTMRAGAVTMAGLVLAGCAVQPVEKMIPTNAAECRMEYREATKRANGAAAGAHGGTLAGFAGAMIGRAIVESQITKDLSACYDRVNAAPSERLPGRGPGAPSAEEDGIMASADPQAVQTQSATPVTPITRRGPGGGAGFGTY